MTFVATDDVARSVDANGEAGVVHQLREVCASRDIRLAERDAAHAALRVGAELRQTGDVLLQAVRVHLQWRFGKGAERKRAGHEGYGQRSGDIPHFLRRPLPP